MGKENSYRPRWPPLWLRRR